MILWDGGFFAELDATRLCCVTGNLGSGKTLIAHEFAEHYLKKGYAMAGNLSSVWLTPLDRITPNEYGQVKTIVLLDEGGLFVRSTASVLALAAFARKLDIYLIFSGRKKPHHDLTELSIYLWFDLWKNFLLPFKVWRYDVQVQHSKSYHGLLWQTCWQAFYGLYSTLDPGDFPQEILTKITEWTENMFRLYHRQHRISDLASHPARRTAEQLADFGNDIADSAQEIASVVSLGGRKSPFSITRR